jgi:hypothetical protein
VTHAGTALAHINVQLLVILPHCLPSPCPRTQQNGDQPLTPAVQEREALQQESAGQGRAQGAAQAVSYLRAKQRGLGAGQVGQLAG